MLREKERERERERNAVEKNGLVCSTNDKRTSNSDKAYSFTRTSHKNGYFPQDDGDALTKSCPSLEIPRCATHQVRVFDVAIVQNSGSPNRRYAMIAAPS